MFSIHRLAFLALILSLCLFLVLGAYQLELPGLHYDEAKEAGLNAMQLVSGQPVTAFRDATVQVGSWRLPLMVQDYIGVLNVLLAIPFLALGGINVVALRWLPLLTGALTLVLAWRVAGRLGGPIAAILTAMLLAVNPSFVFWSRQGIFVTNLTALSFMASLLTGLRWWTGRRPRDLWLTAFFFGLGIYTKLLFVWAIGAMVIVTLVSWLVWRARSPRPATLAPAPRSGASAGVRTWFIAAVCFLLPLVPLIVFNLRTGGTLTSIFGNLGRSYYGVNNSAYFPNLLVRVGQVRTLLRGDHFWYLGELFANSWAPWLAGGLLALALVCGGMRLRTLLPVALLALILTQSAFTVSDLFITHYVFVLPLISLAGGLAAAALLRDQAGLKCRVERLFAARRRGDVQGTGTQDDPRPLKPMAACFSSVLAVLTVLFVIWWAGADFWTTVRYHQVLAISGGYSAHSDAIGHLAEYLDRSGFSAPIALDWGLDAPVRFLTVGRVNPIEMFGYSGLDAPDAGFADRMRAFLDNPNNIYLAHLPDETIFRGRVGALKALGAERGLELREEARFAERSGHPLFVVYRALPPTDGG